MNLHSLKILLLLWLILPKTDVFCFQKTSLSLPHSTPIVLEIANHQKTREQGLMYRRHLSAKQGMLFQFQHPYRWAMWMKNMRFPIDIIWLNQDKQVIDWVDNAKPCSRGLNCPIYQPQKAALDVIELQAGQRQKLNIKLKQTLKY